MFTSRALWLPRKPWMEYDYAKHMPKGYVDRMKRTIPKKIFDGRFGAPPVVRWTVPPDDYVPTMKRPWEHETFIELSKREREYHARMLNSKWFFKQRRTIKPLPEEKWTFFNGDFVQVMIGKDKGKQGTVIRVCRETNEVLVDGLHTKLEDEFKSGDNDKSGKIKINNYRWVEQPLRIDKNEVRLVDPNDKAPCEAKWVLNNTKSEYLRISCRSGIQIPIPSLARMTYEYVQPEKYIDCPQKDTPPEDVLKRTYQPTLKSFEEEITEEMGIKENRTSKPTYWY
ncbi:hypothetical protein WR25_10491 [Diploscapter pachys]|uniref:Large ribosomal subunit protein uL24m n=1 Tax=Diploscapter pachys TaxID=2018661 RepID=A0A2A2JYN4_9BILA|nr:hypothetical protein WR25_10491 [Diploscapter pachys]